MKGIKKYLLFVFLSLIALLPNLALALEVELPGLVLNPSLPQYIAYIFDSIMQGATILALLVMIFGGLYYLASLGTGKMTSEGKEWIKAGVLGLILLLCSWLIMYTINPNLVSLKLDPLFGIKMPHFNIPAPVQPKPPIITFSEIPIGTLIENLLTRTINCYDFDKNGDPIDGDPGTPDWEPTLMNHDQVDCILKLSGAIEKKAKAISDLSEKIAKLMEQCSCSGKCDLQCSQCALDDNAPCNKSTLEYVGKEDLCKGNCVKAKCQGNNDCCPPGKKKEIEEGLDEFRPLGVVISKLIEKEIETNGKKMTVIKQGEWKKLNLISQSTYLNDKLLESKGEINIDLDSLELAETRLGECYGAKTYAEFLKIKESEKKEELIIKKEPFIDPRAVEPVDISRYCKGFNYDNSQCFNVCKKACPEINEPSFNQLKNCAKDDFDCLEKAFYKCPSNSGFDTFQDCLDTCKDRCLASCDQNYGQDLQALQECEDKCDDDSKCIVDNSDKCYVDLTVDLTKKDGFLLNLKKCADKYERDNFANFEKCANDYSLLCKYGSDRYPGYVDCFKKPIENADEYTSLYLFDNPWRQKCNTCFEKIEGSFCTNLFPETSKCPACSRCPKCPCLVSSGECNEFAYNDDPLTFYCDLGGDFWEKRGAEKQKNAKPLGSEWVCSKADEIPVGQTVDEAEAWAEELANLIKQFAETTEKMLEYVKDIRFETGYCQCNSKCSGSEEICKGSCVFSQEQVNIYDDEGDDIIGTKWQCSCNIQPCAGNPCLKMINLLRGKKASDDCPKGTEYKGVLWHYKQVREAVEKLKKLSIETRSEILKRLIYSRKIMDESSLLLFNESNTTKALSCERAKDEMIYPISDSKIIINKKEYKGYCYGTWIGKILKIGPLTDNWFFCEKVIKN